MMIILCQAQELVVSEARVSKMKDIICLQRSDLRGLELAPNKSTMIVFKNIEWANKIINKMIDQPDIVIKTSDCNFRLELKNGHKIRFVSIDAYNFSRERYDNLVAEGCIYADNYLYDTFCKEFYPCLKPFSIEDLKWVETKGDQNGNQTKSETNGN